MATKATAAATTRVTASTSTTTTTTAETSETSPQIMPTNALVLKTSLTTAQALCKTVASLRRAQSTPAFMISDDMLTVAAPAPNSSPANNDENAHGIFIDTDHAPQPSAVLTLPELAASMGKAAQQRQQQQSHETDSTIVRLTPVEQRERDRKPILLAPMEQASKQPQSKQSLGCAHYKRRAMFVTPCCNKFYKCRFCHDENESHHFDRKTLTELICSECNTRQKVQECCEKCGVRFGKYTCLICNLFDDSDKQQYHCDACGICRVGGAHNFFHCEVCNMCLPIQLKIDGHRCVENMSRSNCPVCLGDIHTSRIPCHIPDCGHLLHKMCFDQLLNSGHYTCPTCQTSLIDMTTLWEYLDRQALRTPVPKSYENKRIHIFCNDCHKTSNTNFHFIGLKCMYCGAYNTTQDVKRRRSLVTEEPSTA